MHWLFHHIFLKLLPSRCWTIGWQGNHWKPWSEIKEVADKMKTWPFHVSCPKWSRLVPQFSLHRIKGSWGCAILSSWSLDGTETRRKMKLNWKDGKAPKTRLPGRSGLLERRQTSWFCIKELYENIARQGAPEKGRLPLDANMQCRKKKDLFYNAHISEHLWISFCLPYIWGVIERTQLRWAEWEKNSETTPWCLLLIDEKMVDLSGGEVFSYPVCHRQRKFPFPCCPINYFFFWATFF